MFLNYDNKTNLCTNSTWNLFFFNFLIIRSIIKYFYSIESLFKQLTINKFNLSSRIKIGF